MGMQAFHNGICPIRIPLSFPMLNLIHGQNTLIHNANCQMSASGQNLRQNSFVNDSCQGAV